MDFRPARAGDLAEEFQVFELAQRELHDRRGAPWPGADFADWEPVHLHLLEHDGARSFVAEEAGRVVGFTAAWVRDDVWFLSALFVLPSGRGAASESDSWSTRGATATGAASRSQTPSSPCPPPPTLDAA